MTKKMPVSSIPFLNLRDTYLELQREIDAAVLRVLNSGTYINGPEVNDFEEEWARYCGSNFAVGTSNGLDSLVIALRILGIGKGDEVIVPSHTYIATWLAVTEVGAKIIPVEPNPETYNIDEKRVQAAITKNTKAIIAVHLYGRPVEIDTISEIAKNNKLYLIEDAAQAHGARFKGNRIGSHGDLVCWSFYPGKNLGAFGDAGAITTNSSELANLAKVYLNYGSEKRYEHVIAGSNKRLDPMQAAILRVKLKYLDQWNSRRTKIAEQYISGIENANITVPTVSKHSTSVWHLFVIRAQNRDALIRHLEDQKINTLIHYPTPPFAQLAYKKQSFAHFDLKLAQSLSEQILSLPIGPHLDYSQVSYICDNINKFEI